MLLSRVAEHLYWAARYMERAEDTARVIREHTHLLVDLPTSVRLTWEPLLAVTASKSEFRTRYPAADEDNIVTFLLADRENPSSVLSCVVAARENLRTTRDVLPRAAWQAVNDLYLYATSHHTEAVDRRSRGRFLDTVIGECQRFAGIIAGTMCRDEAYLLLTLGRNIERADMTSRVLDVRAVALLAQAAEPEGAAAHDEVQWAAVLRSLAALQAYHRRRRGPSSGRSTVAFLLRDPDFPGSIAHCLAEVEAVVAGLPRSQTVDMATRSAMRTLITVANGPLDSLHRGLDDVQAAISSVHDEVQATYFPPPPDEPTALDVREDDRGAGAEARTE